MQKGLKTKLNPIIILGVWIVFMMILTPVCMYISNIGASDGEQKPLTTLATMFVVAIYGAAIFSIVTPLLFRHWFKKNWWFSFVIILTIIPVAYDFWDKHSRSPYSSSDINTNINGDEIRTKTEYYDDFKTIRSISIWKNNKRDSVWKVFSNEGGIINQQTFRNDTLLEK
jgi:magnesium-transporting ATPase (P-type)